jgi:molecular chaperone DnaK
LAASFSAQHEVIPANPPVPATRSIPLELPLIPGPISIALFESLDTTTVDRELLGTVRVDLDWRTTHKGPTTLELRMGQDFVLNAALVSPHGDRLPVPITDPRAPRRAGA